MRSVAGGVALLTLGLTSCQVDGGEGYVEIKAVPASAAVPLYLDQVKLEPLRNGNALLRRKSGTTKLETGLDASKLAPLCTHRGAKEPHHQRDRLGDRLRGALPVRAQQRGADRRRAHLHRLARCAVLFLHRMRGARLRVHYGGAS